MPPSPRQLPDYQCATVIGKLGVASLRMSLLYLSPSLGLPLSLKGLGIRLPIPRSTLDRTVDITTYLATCLGVGEGAGGTSSDTRVIESLFDEPEINMNM